MLISPSSLGAALLLATAAFASDPVPIDWAMVARIREEGPQRSRVADLESYMTDRAPRPSGRRGAVSDSC